MKKLVVIILCVSTSITSVAEEVMPVQINRYVEKSFAVSVEQQNPLAEVVDVVLPKNLVLVGHAIEYFLQNSGYSIETSKDLEYGDQYIVFSQLIPSAHRQFSNMRIHDVLQTLIGEAFTLESNPITRKIGFRLNENFRGYLPGDSLSFSSQWKSVELQNDSQADDDLALQTNREETKHFNQLQNIVKDEARSYGPIVAGETLGQIVKGLGFEKRLYFKAIYAMYHLNSQVFNGNLNLLKQGHRLTVPMTEEIENVDSGEAVDFFNNHLIAFQHN